MATVVKSESNIIFYGTVVIPAYVEKYASGVLNFSKPRLIKLRIVYCVCYVWLGVLNLNFKKSQWLRLRQAGTEEIYFRVPSKTTPTTILVAVIKAHRNRATNLNAKTNPNPDLQKTCKKKLKEKRKKIISRTGFEPVTLDSISTIRTLYH